MVYTRFLRAGFAPFRYNAGPTIEIGERIMKNVGWAESAHLTRLAGCGIYGPSLGRQLGHCFEGAIAFLLGPQYVLEV